jgi:cysteine desulfurase/selenocysteine lyase
MSMNADQPLRRPMPLPAADTSKDFCPILDVDRIRRDFPILSRMVHGRPLVYLDNAATTQKPRVVLDALVRYYEKSNANVHRGIHTLAEEATVAYEDVRARVARFVGAKEPSQVVFTRNTTESLNLLAYALAMPTLGPDDVILLTGMEHHSNLVPWQMVAQKTGCQLRFVPVTDDGELDRDAMESMLGPEVKIFAFVHASNVVGTINPAEELIEQARARCPELTVILDAAQSVPHMPVDFAQLGCDAMVFSAHKMYGPMGVGILVGTEELLATTGPFLGGGEMIETVTLERSTYAEAPLRFEAGTPNVADAIGLGAAIEYLESFGMHRIWEHTKCLAAHAREALEALPSIRTFGPEAEGRRSALVTFVDDEMHPHDMAMVLDRDGIAIRAGHHCAMPLSERLGVNSSARASFGLYNTREEVDHLVDSLQRARKFLGCER